jgi:hypothetical protein
MGGTGHDFVEMIEVVEAARADDNEHSLRWPQGLDSPAAALSYTYTTKKPPHVSQCLCMQGSKT